MLIVSNPVDILTYIALKESGYPANRVIGSGTVLDTGRFRYELGEHLGVDSRSIHAFIIGEHGDSELAAWSEARVGGMPIHDFCELRGHYDHEASMEKIFNSVKNSAYEIIARKHATYYGIAMAVCRICAAIVRNEQSILPVSSLMTGEYGLENVVLSIPAVVDENGNLTEEAKLAIEILEQYAKTFQERNPNLYQFNCVMHLDEATPHLHIDYIPVAHGYKTGMETRNSLTKALQQMGFAKAVSKKENETVAWQQRERAYLTDLCREKGINLQKTEEISLEICYNLNKPGNDQRRRMQWMIAERRAKRWCWRAAEPGAAIRWVCGAR